MKMGSMSLMAALLVGAASAARAQPPPGVRGCGMRNPERMEQALRKAGATDKQVAKLREQGYQTRKQMISLRAEKEQAELEVQHLLGQDKVDRDAVMKAVEKLGAAETSIHKLRVQQQLNARELLGEDLAGKLREQAFERRCERREDRGEDRRGGEGWGRKQEGKQDRFGQPPEPEEMPEMGEPPAE